MVEEPRKLHDEIGMAISKSQYTLHTFAQQMNMKLKLLQSYIDGSVIPEKKTIKKMNKFLTPNKISIL
jgi:ribosome-binding protein aMBF1 (putative translation factor)